MTGHTPAGGSLYVDLHGRGGSASSHHILDFGNEPPLSVDGGAVRRLDRRSVSIRWLSATILTGLCGAALMGGAVYAALEGETGLARPAQHVASTLRGGLQDGSRSATRKSDRLARAIETPVTKKTLRLPTTTRIGEQEIVRMRPFTRVASNLTLSPGELASRIPAYNPLTIFAEANPTAAQISIPHMEPDAELTVVMRDLASSMGKNRIHASLGLDEARQAIRDLLPAAPRKPDQDIITGSKGPALAYAAEGETNDPYSGFDVRIVPENISLVAKSPEAPASQPGTWSERTIQAKNGDSVSSILLDLGISPNDAREASHALGTFGRDRALSADHKVKIMLAQNEKNLSQAIRVVIQNEDRLEAIAAMNDLGRYVPVAIQNVASTEATAVQEEDESDGTGVRLYNSLYETALRQQIPKTAIDELIRIYSFDVDFQRRVNPGDSFEVLYSGDDESASSTRDIMFAALSTAGENRKYYRFQTTDDGIIDFYDETGKSAKKFLMRKPMTGGQIRSPFGMRRHPILGYLKMHTGVDWAAPHGTPILASGNGVVEKAGWEGGYGKYIRIKHSNGYESAYGHMSAFARGIQPGTKVRQGQIIGYVGSTGLSTGAHLHYEVYVNERLVDPMRIRLPRGRTLEGKFLAEFERERDRINAMLQQASSSKLALSKP